MTSITEAYVDSLAPNAAAMKNGRDLVKKNSFAALRVTEDETLLFGECKGSGKDPYRCSADFNQESAPVFRCSCPSRQFPCKHTLGLLYAHALGKPFEKAEIPQDIAEKREKAEKREEKKKETAALETEGDSPKAKRKGTSKSAFLKKRNAQLEGLNLLEKLVLQLVQTGLGGVDAKSLKLLEDQAKELGNYYVPGAQAELRELVLILKEETDQEAVYSRMIEQIIRLQALVKKGKAYLEQRSAEPELPMDSVTTIEEQLGHAWQLAELREAGRTKAEAELMQLSFLSYEDQARGEYVDTGWWIDLQDGVLYTTRTMRPFRAAKYIKEEDTVQEIIQAEELFIYPGETNPRVRWEKARFRERSGHDCDAVKALAADSFPEVIKRVKNDIKNPLAEKNPVYLLAYHSIERIGDSYVFRDAQGKQLPVSERDIVMAPQQARNLLPLLKEEDLRDQAALVMFRHDLDSGRLEVQIMSLITDRRIIRLLY
ncbi:SWIM zinc finger family protein [Gorillibacterium timonense]|uniref:SWIM zinc finger family protein n=1 Tax=Gorillibacterium timonense TaxID=1689269 RepID=UPI00071D63B6|nr:SWIM zinc finger family protein [Gorillibacterium timonense]